MSVIHQVAGPVLIVVNGNVNLGYSRDGVQIRIEPKYLDIMSDDWGGANGVPADTQILGAIGHVTAEMNKYERDELHRLTSFERAGTAGVLPQFGTLIRQELEYTSLYLDGKHENWSFSTAFVRQAIEVNKGTRYSTAVVGWECWMDSTQTRRLMTITVE